MEIRVVSKSGILPEFKTEGSAGADLRAFIEEDITLLPMERRLIPTGLYIELPMGVEAEVWARSGLSINNGITMINGVGTVDSDYRGEWCVPLVNLGSEPYTIKNGDRIAQVVFKTYIQPEFKLSLEINETLRGSGGFGSTGK